MWEQLILAIFQKNTEEAVQIINNLEGDEIKELLKPQFLNNLVLHEAAKAGSLEVCQAILKKCPEAVNVIDWLNQSALHEAARWGHTEICEMLLPKMAQKVINTPDSNGAIALENTLSSSNKTNFNLLLKFTSPLMVIKSMNELPPVESKVKQVIKKFIKQTDFSSFSFKHIENSKLFPLYKEIIKSEPNGVLAKLGKEKGMDKFLVDNFFTFMKVCKPFSKEDDSNLTDKEEDIDLVDKEVFFFKTLPEEIKEYLFSFINLTDCIAGHKKLEASKVTGAAQEASGEEVTQAVEEVSSLEVTGANAEVNDHIG